MRKLIVHGSYHLGNFGDQLMLDLISAEVKRRFGLTPVCPWLRRDCYARCEAKPGRGLASALFASAAILGGGGYFHNDNARAERRLLRYVVPARTWQLLRIPYVIIGVGAGPVLNGTGARRVRDVANGARAVCVRDEESRDLLLEAGVEEKRLKVTADLVLGLNREQIPRAARETARRLLPARSRGTRRLGLHLPLDPVEHPFMEDLIEQVQQAVRGRDVQVVWLFDREFGLLPHFQARACATSENATCIRVENHWVEAALIGELDAVITCGLHVGVAAWALGVPPCGYSIHGKTRRFYRQIGRQRFQADVDNTPPGILRDWIMMFVEDPAGFAVEDNRSRQVLPVRALQNYDIMEAALR